MDNQKQDLPPIYSREDFETDAEYTEYLSIESDNFSPTIATEDQVEEASKIAENTIKRRIKEKTPIALRLSSRDIERVKSVALQKGMPYQTLIGSVLHQYLDGDLTERTQ